MKKTKTTVKIFVSDPPGGLALEPGGAAQPGASRDRRGALFRTRRACWFRTCTCIVRSSLLPLLLYHCCCLACAGPQGLSFGPQGRNKYVLQNRHVKISWWCYVIQASQKAGSKKWTLDHWRVCVCVYHVPFTVTIIDIVIVAVYIYCVHVHV